MWIPWADGMIVQDLLEIHMIRTTTTSTIISCHPRSKLHGMSSKRLQFILKRNSNGVPVHWPKVAESMSKDPTFTLIAILRSVHDAWEEAFEALHHRLCELVCNTTCQTAIAFILSHHNSSRKARTPSGAVMVFANCMSYKSMCRVTRDCYSIFVMLFFLSGIHRTRPWTLN